MNLVNCTLSLDQIKDLALTIRAAKFGRDVNDPVIGRVNDIAIEASNIFACSLTKKDFNQLSFLSSCGIK